MTASHKVAVEIFDSGLDGSGRSDAAYFVSCCFFSIYGFGWQGVKRSRTQ